MQARVTPGQNQQQLSSMGTGVLLGTEAADIQEPGRRDPEQTARGSGPLQAFLDSAVGTNSRGAVLKHRLRVQMHLI